MALSRENNFDFLRLLFASFVIVSHSFPLTGNFHDEILRKFTSGSVDFGGLGVRGFLTISGFLIFQSLMRSKTLASFFWKRFLRIYPALIVMLILVMLIIPFIYASHTPFFQNKSYWMYPINVLSMLNISYQTIGGVFDHNAYHVVNGSLGTIYYEICLYILFSVFFYIPKKLHLPLLITIFVISYTLAIFYPEFLNKRLFSKLNLWSPVFYDLICYFTMGAILSVLSFDKYKYKNILLVISCILIIVSIPLSFYTPLKHILTPIIVIAIGSSATKYLKKTGTYFGDISYGIYIYGWFIQQILITYVTHSPYLLMLYSLIVAFIIGWISWHFVEKKALLYKNVI